MGIGKNPTEFFVDGGTLGPDTPSYVQRPADGELFTRALAGEFCYVLTPRQMGKSSLMVRTAIRLEERAVRTAIIDLTRIGTDVSVEQWYFGLLSQLERRLRLSVDLEAWWQERASLGYVQRLTDFLRDVILAEIGEPVVIFIDEIDSTLSLDFTDDFFAAIRAMYNARAEDPEFQRLAFILLGVASPADLIKDRSRTPFNIGYGVALEEFSKSAAAVLQEGLEAVHPGQGEAIFARIFHWSHGHPYITQKLCRAVAETPDGNWTDSRIDELVEKLFLSEEARREANLQFVQDNILNHPQRHELLDLYRKVVKRRKVGDDGQSPLQNQLKLSGLVKVDNGFLRVRNEIYRRAFDLAWIRRHTSTNWARFVAGVATVIALLAVAVIARDFWVQNQVTNAYAHFHLTDKPEERLADLAKICRASLFLSPDAYDYRARELFFGMEEDDQKQLFESSATNDSDLIVVIRCLYVTLGDVDGSSRTYKVLEAMKVALYELDRRDKPVQELKDEIEHWLQGRRFVRSSDYESALGEYDKAVELNDKNQATLYERAWILIQLNSHRKALKDLDKVMALAFEDQGFLSPADETPTPFGPTISGTGTPHVTSPVSLTGTYIAPPDSTERSTPTMTPSPSPANPPDVVTPRFMTFVDVKNAVRRLIYGNPDLVVSLMSALDSEYPNLQESGLVLTPTPTAGASATSPSDGSPVMGGFQGIVLDDESGTKVAGVRIVFVSEDGSITREATSDPNGAYQVDLPKGRYQVTASHDDYEPYTTGIGFFVVPGPGLQTGNIFLEPKAKPAAGSASTVAAGTIPAGVFWYHGAENISCEDVCASHGGYHDATRTYAGSDGSAANCENVLNALNIPLDNFFETAQGGIGCFTIQTTSGNYAGYWDEKPTTASATYVTPGRRRICGCKN